MIHNYSALQKGVGRKFFKELVTGESFHGEEGWEHQTIPKGVPFCIINTILAFYLNTESSKGLALRTRAKGAMVRSGRVPLCQVLEEHPLGTQGDLEMNP